MMRNFLGQRKNGDISVVSIVLAGDGWRVHNIRLKRNGVLVKNASSRAFSSEDEAQKRAEKVVLSRTKANFIPFMSPEFVGDLTYSVVSNFMSPETSEGNDVLMERARELIDSFVVVFEDVNGIEESFDVGVEYLATMKKDYLVVFNRFGEEEICDKKRLSACVKASRESKLDKFFERLVYQERAPKGMVNRNGVVLPLRVAHMCVNHKKIASMRVYQTSNGCSLKEAKEVIEEFLHTKTM